MACSLERHDVFRGIRVAGFFAARRKIHGLWLALMCLAGAKAADLRVVGTDMLGVEFSKALYAFAVTADVRWGRGLDSHRLLVAQPPATNPINL